MTTTAVASAGKTQVQSQVTVTVYGLSACSHTTKTRLALSDAGVSVIFIELAQNPTACEYVASFQCYETPFVEARTDGSVRNWFGHRPDLITALMR